MEFNIFIESLPPGINETYGIKPGGMYKTEVAVRWAEDAALLIGAKAGVIDWKDDSEFYGLDIIFNNWRQDVDAPIKLVIDTLSQKLGFDDKRILDLHIKKRRKGKKGIILFLYDTEEE